MKFQINFLNRPLINVLIESDGPLHIVWVVERLPIFVVIYAKCNLEV